MFELPRIGVEKTKKKEAVGLALEIACGFQCQRSAESLGVHFRTCQLVHNGLGDADVR